MRGLLSLSARVVLIILLLVGMPSGAAFSQTDADKILRFGTTLLRALTEQQRQDSRRPQEADPPARAQRPERTAPQAHPQQAQASSERLRTAAPRISRAQVAEAQELLNRLGFDAGLVDGMMGPRTRRAIQAYQRDSGLALTGMPDDRLLASLRANATAVVASSPRGSDRAASEAKNKDLTAQQRGSDPLLGLWSGEFVCLGSPLSIKVAIVDAFGGRHAFVQVLDKSRDPSHRHHTRNRIYAVPETAHGKPAELQWLGGFTGRHRFTLHQLDAGTGRLVADHEGCKEMAFAPVQLPEQGAHANALAGTWTGHFEACRQGVLSARLDVIGTFPGQYLMDAEYVQEASAGSRRTDRDAGRKLFFGVRESGGGPVSFAEIARLRTGRNGEPVGYGSAITQIELEHDAAHGALYGRTDRCEYGEFAKEGGQQEMTASAAAPAAQPKTDLGGEWEGYARCGGGADIPVTLLLEPSGTGQIKGLIEYAQGGAITYGVVRQSVLGQPAASGEGYDFVVERTLPGGRGPAPAGFTLRPDVSGAGIVADYDGASCSPLELARVTQQSTSRRPTVALPADGGAFFASRQPREKCEAVAAWLAKVKSEYPGLDIMRTVLDQVYPKVAVLFADDDFVPVFGTPFDQMTDEQRREILRQFGALCKRDPFLRERVQGFAVVERAFLQTLDRPSTSFGLQAIHALVREARRLRTAIRTTLGSLPPEAGLDQSVQILTPLKRKIENGAEYLWPSERQAALEEIRARLSASALAAAEADLERIAAMEEPSERLKALTAVHADRNAYSQHLLPAERTDLQRLVLDEQRRIADGLIGPMLARLEAVPVDETALIQISSLEPQIEPTLEFLVDDLAVEYRKKIGRTRQDTFEALVRAKLAELETHEPGRSGLSESAAWPARFATLFEGFEESPLYEQAMQGFRDARQALLEESLPAFEAELQRIAGEGGAGIDHLLSEYLSWEGDAGFPISLMYEMAAQSLGGTGSAGPAHNQPTTPQPHRGQDASATATPQSSIEALNASEEAPQRAAYAVDVDEESADPASARALAERCNDLAGSPYEAENVGTGGGVAPGDIDAPRAIAVCSQALAAAPGTPSLQFRLARAHHVHGDHDAAAELYAQAAGSGHALAQTNLGVLYDHGLGVPQDSRQAAVWFRKAADQGQPVAQHNLGVSYAAGRGVREDPSQAARWYRRAAEQGYPPAQNSLGVMYEGGTGAPQSDAEAVAWYRKAAEQGDATGQANLGRMYEGGRGVARDDAEAAAWYRRAAEQGYAWAQARLGLMYENGRGVPQDLARARTLYGQACAGGFADGCESLASMVEHGQGGAQDKARARELFEQACAEENVDGCHQAAEMFRTGQGGPQDEAGARALYEQACAGGGAGSCFNAGLMFHTGQGGSQDHARARELYEQACAGGSAGGCLNLGGMLEKGEGGPRDQDQAVHWYTKAAEQGNQVAIAKLEEQRRKAEEAAGRVREHKERPFSFVQLWTMTSELLPIARSICKTILCDEWGAAGTLAGIRELAEGKYDATLVSAKNLHNAYHGVGPFSDDGPAKNLRVIVALNRTTPIFIMARAGANIGTLNDLRGKNVNLGLPDTPLRDAFDDIMSALGMSSDDFAAVYELNYNKQIEGLCAGTIDAGISVGYSWRLIEELQECDLRLVALSEAEQARVAAPHPYYRALTSSALPQYPYGVATVGYEWFLATTEGLPEDKVLVAVAALVENFEGFKAELYRMSEQWPRLQSEVGHWRPADFFASEAPVPLHAGTMRYLEEEGIDELAKLQREEEQRQRDLEELLSPCTPSATFVVSPFDKATFEKMVNSQAGIKVAVGNSLFSALGSKAFAEWYPDVRLFPQKFSKMYDVREALERHFVDAAAYECTYFLSFPNDVKRLFGGMNAWVLPAGKRARTLSDEAREGGQPTPGSEAAAAERASPTDLAERSRAATLAYDSGNLRRARELFDQTCTGGDAESCFRLGVMVFRGEGGQQDKAQARALFDQACKGGDARGCSALR